MAIDQYGKRWALSYKAGVIWATGFDDDGNRCIRQVHDREIIVDWHKPRAVRHLTLKDARE
jgi:hypothetical protein